MNVLFIARTATPIGVALLVTDATGTLRALDFEDHAARMQRLLRIHYGHPPLQRRSAPAPLTLALQRYFEGELSAFEDVACATAGTSFQRSVWRALRQIAPGRTTTYGALARRLGNAAASRAVGLANGSNPLGIIVPCHRVIGADGSLTGYGGGLERKRWLLRHEGVEGM